MNGSPFYCPRCGTAVIEVKSSRPALTLGGEIFAFASASVLIELVILVLVVAGFEYPVAWLLALGLGGFAYARFRRGERRFMCGSCGVEFPHDMVRQP